MNRFNDRNDVQVIEEFETSLQSKQSHSVLCIALGPGVSAEALLFQRI